MCGLMKDATLFRLITLLRFHSGLNLSRLKGRIEKKTKLTKEGESLIKFEFGAISLVTTQL